MSTEACNEWRRRRAEIPEWLGVASLEDAAVSAAVQAFCHGACDYGEMMEKLLQFLIEDRKQNIRRILRLEQMQPGPSIFITEPPSGPPPFCLNCGAPI